jgi:hypothetical protein
MSWWIRRPVFALVALALLTGLGAGYVEDWFHTDDGCAVEVHCLACQRVLGGATVFAPVPILAPAAVVVAAPLAPEPLVRSTITPRLLQSRAPPLA